MVSILWLCKPIPYQGINYNRNKFVRQQNIMTFRTGSRHKSNVGKKILLINLFPDSPERIAYQNEKRKFYKSGLAKFREAKKLRIPAEYVRESLTVSKKDAFDYFNGTGFYEEYQNPKTLPNIFDTRHSFLLKMEDRETINNFLNSSNNRFNKDH